jgi:hypothetical protein
MGTRRDFARWLAGASALGPVLASVAGESDAMPSPPDPPSHVGSLYPFIIAQSPSGEPRLSFLRAEFRDVNTWRHRARRALLDRLHYAPHEFNEAMQAEAWEWLDRWLK